MKKTEKLTFRCTKELKQTLESNAKKRNMKQTDYMEYLIYQDNLENRHIDYASMDRKIRDLWHSQIRDREDIRTLYAQVIDIVKAATGSITKENQDIFLLALKSPLISYNDKAEKREATLEEMHESMPISKSILIERRDDHNVNL